MSWNFERLAGPYGGTTEGPVWDGHGLIFSHIHGDRIMRYDPAAETCMEYRTDTKGTNGLARSPSGELYGCRSGEHCVARYNADGSVTPLLNKLDGVRINRPNDIAVDRKGRIWFTDPFGVGRPVSERQLDHASVLRLDPQPDGSWTLKRMTFDTTSPNGIMFSRDERTLYVAQSDYSPTAVRELRAYQIMDDDTLGPHTVLHTFGKDSRGVHRGVDGMCLDMDGNIVACAGNRDAGPGPLMYVFSPAGRVLETHLVPAHRPTNCAFGGPNLDILYITTGGGPGGGQLLQVRNTGRRGWPLHPL